MEHRLPHLAPRRLSAALIAALVGLGSPSPISAGDDARRDLEPPLLQRIVTQTTRSGFGVRATREMRAGMVDGKHEGWMTVETRGEDAGPFTWQVMEQGGSERTRKKVFVTLLETEAETWRRGARDAAALTPANYRFSHLSSDEGGVMRLRLTPRRADARLVDGVLTVSADGFPLQLEGKLAKSPSFWVKSVTIVKRFERIAGVALPVSVESLADMRWFGQAIFSMRYRYHEVDGRRVSHALASTTEGPSEKLRQLHAGLLQQ